ncbi:MAG: PDZ domain-containing protein, partial [Patescibacteria group bacterium]
QAASFAWDQSIIGLASTYSISSNGDVSPLYIGQPHYAPAVAFEQYVLQTNTLAKRFNPDTVFAVSGNAMVIDNGDIVGIADRNGVIPADHFRTSLEQVLTERSIKRIALKISYYDNAWMPHTQISKSALSMTGATIVDPGTASAELKKGDVVIHVNNENIDINRSFSDIISQYKPGTTVRLGITREGKSMDVSLALK